MIRLPGLGSRWFFFCAVRFRLQRVNLIKKRCPVDILQAYDHVERFADATTPLVEGNERLSFSGYPNTKRKTVPIRIGRAAKD